MVFATHPVHLNLTNKRDVITPSQSSWFLDWVLREGLRKNLELRLQRVPSNDTDRSVQLDGYRITVFGIPFSGPSVWIVRCVN